MIKKVSSLCTIIFILMLSEFLLLQRCQDKVEDTHEEAILLSEHPYFLLEEIDADVLYHTMVYYNFPHPEIITAQAILETGYFRSRLCVENNNLFGLYDSKNLEYYIFDSWVSSVFAYKDLILCKYDGKEDYYEFLKRIHYAEDPSYITKLKAVQAKIYKEIRVYNN